MLEELIKIDQQILLLFNRYHTVYWDQVMWVYTGKYIWIPLILSFVWVYFRKKLERCVMDNINDDSCRYCMRSICFDDL